MSHDIKIYWREFGGDLTLLDGDLAGEDDLTTAVTCGSRWMKPCAPRP